MQEIKKTRVCIAGATGWAASELCRAIAAEQDLEIVAAVARRTAGRTLNDVLGINFDRQIMISENIGEALETPCDVVMDYTSPLIAEHNIITSLDKSVNVVVGTSGLTDIQYRSIGQLAQQKNKGVLAVGNFAISVVLLTKFSEIAARYMPSWEIIDYASDQKIDAPSGSALELVHRLAAVRKPEITIPIGETKGYPQTRGATINDMQVHSVRLPGFVISLETIFGMEGEKLTIKHEAGDSAKPYVAGAMLAIRKVGSFTGLKRGLDQVMDW